MPVIHEITDLTAPELDIYARLTQAQLRNRLEPEKGIFIAESPKVIARALDAGYQPLSLLMERKQITRPGTGDFDPLRQCAGVHCRPGAAGTAHRLCTDPGRAVCLPPPCAPHGGAGVRSRPPGGCAGRHRRFHQRGRHLPQRRSAEHGRSAHYPLLLRPAVPPRGAGKHGHRISGAVGADRTCPADWPENGSAQLHALGFKTAAMALSDRSVSIDDPALAAEPKLAIVLGTEGDGLANSTIAACDYTVKIPMSHGVDSLNVAAASAVAFWAARPLVSPRLRSPKLLDKRPKTRYTISVIIMGL